MDTDVVQSLADDLEADIDSLEESLKPILQAALSTRASKLPLLDKAKLYVLATYAIESILFSALRLNGVDAKTHPVFAELARVKEYFAKIKTAETGPAKRTATLDKDAATRLIKHGLTGNEKYDHERADHQSRAAGATSQKLEQLSAKGTHTRFDHEHESESSAQATPLKRHHSSKKEDKRAAKRQRRVEAHSAKQSSVGNTATRDDNTVNSGGPKTTSEAFHGLLERDPEKKKKKHKKQAKNDKQDT